MKATGPNISEKKPTIKNSSQPLPVITKSSCCGPDGKSKQKTSYRDLDVKGYVETAAGRIPKVNTQLSARDRAGTVKVRLNIGRDNYMIAPGLYAAGDPDKNSPVLVSANYKLSFDHLRSHLSGINAWILVLDTKGINVWCAAGKGTFGTDEMIKRIKIASLGKVVSHRRVILPQLGAPGVAAHIVARETGFKPVYGPVRAADIKRFLDAGMKADREMRRVRFGFISRLILTPVEFSLALKYLFMAIAVFLLLSGISSRGFSLDNIISRGAHPLLVLILAFLAGTVITPLLIPFIPGRAFSFKGLISGIFLYCMLYFFLPGFNGGGYVELVSLLLLTLSITSFFAMNFTGSTTFTSLSGVMKELKIAVPVQAVAASAGLVLFIISRFL